MWIVDNDKQLKCDFFFQCHIRYFQCFNPQKSENFKIDPNPTNTHMLLFSRSYYTLYINYYYTSSVCKTVFDITIKRDSVKDKLKLKNEINDWLFLHLLQQCDSYCSSLGHFL